MFKQKDSIYKSRHKQVHNVLFHVYDVQEEEILIKGKRQEEIFRGSGHILLSRRRSYRGIAVNKFVKLCSRC